MKQKRYWLRGGIIGIAISILAVIILFTTPQRGFCPDAIDINCIPYNFFTLINILAQGVIFTPLYILGLLGKILPEPTPYTIPFFTSMVSVVIYCLSFFFLGWLYGKIVKDRSSFTGLITGIILYIMCMIVFVFLSGSKGLNIFPVLLGSAFLFFPIIFFCLIIGYLYGKIKNRNKTIQ